MNTPDPHLEARIDEVTEHATHVVELAGTAIAIGAMLILALRASLRLELRWDTFYYHLPFAARHARMGVPYEPIPMLEAYYHGAPPLPEFLQGLLWRLTGSINATGVVNYLALALFLYFAWKHLGARLWLLTVLALTVPMVLIHAASSYVDLCTQAFVAIGVTGFLSMVLFDRWSEKRLLLWTLGGLAAGAWSKFSAPAIVLPVMVALLTVYGWQWQRGNAVAKRQLLLVVAGLVVTLLPYAKNEVLYRNPTWPTGIALFRGYFPTKLDLSALHDEQIPPPLMGQSQSSIFFHSLFEVGHPTSYPNRERWNIDQGNAWIAYRSDGFWVVAVVTGAVVAVLLGFLSARWRGWTIAGTILLLWCFLSVLPQSNELRYFQFLPLTVSTLIAVLWPRVRVGYPVTSLTIVVLLLAEFIWVTKVNKHYYSVEHVGYKEAAEFWGIEPYWKTMQPGETYCAVNFRPAGFLLTGPTMHEFHIIDRQDAAECPAGVKVLQR